MSRPSHTVKKEPKAEIDIIDICDSSDDERDVAEAFIVKRIIAERVTARGKEYFVEWLEYSFDECSWEKAWRLKRCDEVLRVFRAEQEAYARMILKSE
jgi:hypothetical protein